MTPASAAPMVPNDNLSASGAAWAWTAGPAILYLLKTDGHRSVAAGHLVYFFRAAARLAASASLALARAARVFASVPGSVITRRRRRRAGAAAAVVAVDAADAAARRPVAARRVVPVTRRAAVPLARRAVPPERSAPSIRSSSAFSSPFSRVSAAFAATRVWTLSTRLEEATPFSAGASARKVVRGRPRRRVGVATDCRRRPFLPFVTAMTAS